MIKRFGGWNLFLSVLLTASLVVADGVKPLATGQDVKADLVRRAPHSSITLASATEAPSATTSGTNELLSLVASNSFPPLPPDVTELKFNEFFRQPIGPRGLDFSEKLRSLEGRRIRILGYMVRQDQPAEHCFLLAPVPLTLHEDEYGLADDLPATALHVFTTADAPARTPYTPGLLLLTGKLSLGNQTETDERISIVRLKLDPPTAEQKEAAQAAAGDSAVSTLSAGHLH